MAPAKPVTVLTRRTRMTIAVVIGPVIVSQETGPMLVMLRPMRHLVEHTVTVLQPDVALRLHLHGALIASEPLHHSMML